MIASRSEKLITFGFPRTAYEWINLTATLDKKLLIAEHERSSTVTWLFLAFFVVAGLLYILCLYRVLYLKKHYIVKRDSFGRLCPHSCLLISILGILHVTGCILDVAFRHVYRHNPFPVVKIVLNQFIIWDLYCLAVVRTWGVWSAMPPSAFQLGNSKVSKWRSRSPLAIAVLNAGFFVMTIVTNVPLVRVVARVEKNWPIIRGRLDHIVHRAITRAGVAPSPMDLRFEIETLMLLLNLKKDGDDFLKHLRIFSTAAIVFLISLMGVFCYASIAIIHALNTQMRFIDAAAKRVKTKRQGASIFSPGGRSGSFASSESPRAMRRPIGPSLLKIPRNLSRRSIAAFFTKEELDYSLLKFPFGDTGMLEQARIITKKKSSLRRHWWRVFLQFVCVTGIALSYCTLLSFVALNFWKIGDGRFFPEAEPHINDWKTWTWVAGPGPILAAITCLAEFLDDGMQRHESEPGSRHSVSSSGGPDESFDPFSNDVALALQK